MELEALEEAEAEVGAAAERERGFGHRFGGNRSGGGCEFYCWSLAEWLESYEQQIYGYEADGDHDFYNVLRNRVGNPLLLKICGI